MSLHRFTLGQSVDLTSSPFRAIGPGPYEIRSLIPAGDRSPEDPCYRIKNVDEKHERAAMESELTLWAGASS